MLDHVCPHLSHMDFTSSWRRRHTRTPFAPARDVTAEIRETELHATVNVLVAGEALPGWFALQRALLHAEDVGGLIEADGAISILARSFGLNEVSAQRDEGPEVCVQPADHSLILDRGAAREPTHQCRVADHIRQRGNGRKRGEPERTITVALIGINKRAPKARALQRLRPQPIAPYRFARPVGRRRHASCLQRRGYAGRPTAGGSSKPLDDSLCRELFGLLIAVAHDVPSYRRPQSADYANTPSGVVSSRNPAKNRTGRTSEGLCDQVRQPSKRGETQRDPLQTAALRADHRLCQAEPTRALNAAERESASRLLLWT